MLGCPQADILELTVGDSPLAVRLIAKASRDASGACRASVTFELELEREQAAVDWIRGIWEAMEAQQVAAAAVLAGGGEARGGAGGGSMAGQPGRSELNLIEEQDRANTAGTLCSHLSSCHHVIMSSCHHVIWPTNDETLVCTGTGKLGPRAVASLHYIQ